jgi:hypothetical protein
VKGYPDLIYTYPNSQVHYKFDVEYFRFNLI